MRRHGPACLYARMQIELRFLAYLSGVSKPAPATPACAFAHGKCRCMLARGCVGSHSSGMNGMNVKPSESFAAQPLLAGRQACTGLCAFPMLTGLQDQTLIDAFKHGRDIHTETANMVRIAFVEQRPMPWDPQA